MYLCILRRYVCSEQIRKSTDGNRLSEWRKILFERKQIMAVVCNNKFFAGFLLGQTKCLAETQLLSAQPASTSS